MTDWSVIDNKLVPWSNSAIMQPQPPPQPLQDFSFEQAPTSQIPWNGQIHSFGPHADTGVVTFQSSPGPTFDKYLAGQAYLDTFERDRTPVGRHSPVGGESDFEGWQEVNVPSYPNSSIPSQPSPHSDSSGGSPFSIIEAPDTPHQTPSPKAQQNVDHKHIFTSDPGIKKLPRGRQRALTTKEKKEAREVREAKACWACHLSKIKVSPLAILT